MSILLTSAGFDNKEILRQFRATLSRSIESSRLLFVPTAAISEGGKEMLPFCRAEIAEAGFLADNVIEVQIADLGVRPDLAACDAIYVAGGDTEHLVKEMNKHNFRDFLDSFLDLGGTYMGVSAGSIALTSSFSGCLGYLHCKLNVHCNLGSSPGPITTQGFPEINLTDNQAVLICGTRAEVIG